MPTKRRSGGATASSKAQSTLAFHAAKQNRVTKPGSGLSGLKGSSPSAKGKSRTASPAPPVDEVPASAQSLEEDEEEGAELEGSEEEEEAEEEAVVQPLPPAPAPKPKVAEEDERARALSQANIKAYWDGKEKQRTAPRLHQQELSLHEKILREFDISGQYGVSFSLLLHSPYAPSFRYYRMKTLFLERDTDMLHLLKIQQPCVGISRLRRWRRANKLGLEPPIEVLAVLLKDERDQRKSEQLAHVDVLLAGQRTAAGES